MGQRNIFERYAWFDARVRGKKFPNASILAKRFEISSKTAQRDIEFMRDRLHAPLVFNSSEKGYFYENGEFSLPVTHLSSEEISSLVLAKRLLGDIEGQILSAELQSVIGKLTAILHDHVQQPEGLDEAISIYTAGHTPAPEDVFNLTLKACLHRRKLFFSYYSPIRDEKTSRVGHPWHLFSYKGTWHMVAWCEKRQGLRDFVLARMSGLRLLEETFERSPDFRIDTYLNSAFGLFKGPATTAVVLRFDPGPARWVQGQIWHRNQKAVHLEDGSLELTIPVSNLAEIQMEILKHGAGVMVVSPPELRDRIAAEARALARRYKAATPSI